MISLKIERSFMGAIDVRSGCCGEKSIGPTRFLGRGHWEHAAAAEYYGSTEI